VTWNPASEKAGVHERFRLSSDPLIRVVEMNWRDNPKFPAKLERERQRDLTERPDQYEHIWEGAFVSVVEGAYYAKSLTAARQAKRIGNVSQDPLLTHRLFFDIGGTGLRADAVSIWDAQFVGREVRVLNYYEAVGQPLATHLNWMREHDLLPKRTQVYLPHDGDTQDKVYAVSYKSALEAAGYDVEVVPNQGRGAAKQRIEAGRRWFPSIWFNEATTEAGLKALGWYHEKQDEKRLIGLGPDHDWSSHAADAFGLMCVCAESIFGESNKVQQNYYAGWRR
jgi:phage terminase large subunit